MSVCAAPLDAAVLTDYWAGVLDDPVIQEIEEHVFGCETCSARLAEAASFADALRGLARSGDVQGVVGETLLRRAAAGGKRVREYTLSPGESVRCTVTLEDDYLVSTLRADFGSAKRVDLRWEDGNGVELGRCVDIPVSPDSGSVAFQQPISWAKAAGDGTMVAHLFAVEDSGEERLLGAYTFVHTRTIPGPGRV